MVSRGAAWGNRCVDVAVVSVLIGLASGYDRAGLRDLGAGALLHDVGKVKIPTEVLDKPGSLTPHEFERVKLHTTQGYQIISQSNEFSYIAAHAALEHLERLDGSGYPRRLRGDKILEIGRIVAVADVFCAMTSDRPYRRRVLPREAIRHLMTASTKFDQRFVRRLALRVAAFPNGTFLRLSTGELAVVVRQDGRDKERPVVRILADAGNRPVEQHEVPLAEVPEVKVAAVVDRVPEAVRQALGSWGVRAVVNCSACLRDVVGMPGADTSWLVCVTVDFPEGDASFGALRLSAYARSRRWLQRPSTITGSWQQPVRPRDSPAASGGHVARFILAAWYLGAQILPARSPLGGRKRWRKRAKRNCCGR